MSCYRMNYLYFDQGMFDQYIDMVYVLTMENSSREANYLYQLNKYKPLSKVIIQYNKGYKLCKKNIYEQNSIGDLNHAYLNVFLHAQKNNYSNILIFEDDFFFDKTINMNIVNSIGNFITNNKYHVYNFGTIQHISFPSLIHIRCIEYASSHACIYNRLYIDWFIKKYDSFNVAVDEIWANLSIIKYKYYKPICFQSHYMTDNLIDSSKRFIKNSKKLKQFLETIIKISEMDSNPVKFYNNSNRFCSIISYFLFFILILIIYYIIYTIFYKKT